jgi:polysaccharide pyruvyl transferase WcaK-like protein
MRRRTFLAFASLLPQSAEPLLLRSGWQTENIGDIAHTPGLLTLLEKHLPGRPLILWSNATDRGVAGMLRRRFPRLQIVGGEPGSDGVERAFAEASFFLHGSGPSVVARGHLEAWRRTAGKPYGVFGVTVAAAREAASPALDAGLQDLLSAARFVYTRETRSLENLRAAGVRAPLAFVPDATFAVDLENEAAAKATLRRAGFDQPGYLCVVPRLRYTPYHKIRSTNWSPEEIARREEVNQRHAESDHAKLRSVVIRWVRETRRGVLFCPEMTYQVELLAPLLRDPLPEDVKRRTAVLPHYWITDEARSVYRQAAAVVSMECHSPILAVSAGVPGFYVHQPEDGIKGRMWKDVGLGECYSEVETVQPDELFERIRNAVVHARDKSRMLEAVRQSIARQHQSAVAEGPGARP